jgi:hypothetical protein
MPVRAGESKTHRTAGGGAARLRPRILSHLLRDEDGATSPNPALKDRAKLIPPLRGEQRRCKILVASQGLH